MQELTGSQYYIAATYLSAIVGIGGTVLWTWLERRKLKALVKALGSDEVNRG